MAKEPITVNGLKDLKSELYHICGGHFWFENVKWPQNQLFSDKYDTLITQSETKNICVGK